MYQERMQAGPKTLLSEAKRIAAEASNGRFLLGGRTKQWALAAETYERAGNGFRMQKQSVEAGKAFEQCANIQRLKLSEPNEAANALVEAFKSYRKEKPLDAVHCIGLAIQQFATTGLLRRAANCQQMMAECYEEKLKDHFRAIETYELAAAWLESDNAEGLVTQCHRKIGELAGYLENWPKAIMSFELVASTKSWLAKECLFKARLAHLAMMDAVSFDRWIERYANMEASFSNSKEHFLLLDLGVAVRDGDRFVFWEICRKYHDVHQAETWRTFVLFKIKARLEVLEVLEVDFS